MSHTAEQISKVLAEIQFRIPKNLLDAVIREGRASPHVKQVVELAIADPDFPPVKKEKLRQLLARGDFDKKKYIENPKIARMIDNFLGREINKAVKAGRLPPKSKVGNLPHVREIYARVQGKII